MTGVRRSSFFYEEFKISVLYKLLLTWSGGGQGHAEFSWET